MQVLTTRVYTRVEIAEIIGIDPKNKNFARKVKDTLQKWGYSYQYKRTQVTILKMPQTKEERIAEIALRELGLDVQVDAPAFAAFLFALQFDEEFGCSPWSTRVKLIDKMFDIKVAESTLRKWAKKLIDLNLIIKEPENRQLWYTVSVDGEKFQSPVEEDMEAYEYYKKDMQTFLKEEQERENPEVWKTVYKRLWDKHKTVYYWCKPFTCNALVNEDIRRMFELVEDLYIFEDGIFTFNDETEETHIFD